ncbi:MAG: 4-hydroxy-tetrahydrodipicolinate reductase, partial [uncultured Blastococcus sp.]
DHEHLHPGPAGFVVGCRGGAADQRRGAGRPRPHGHRGGHGGQRRRRPRAGRDGRRRRLAVRHRECRGAGRRGLHPARRRHGQHPVLHRQQHPLRRGDDGDRRGPARHDRRVAGAQAGRGRGRRPQLRHRRGPADEVRPGGGPLLPVGGDRGDAPPRQGRRPVRHGGPHRPPRGRGPADRRPPGVPGRHDRLAARCPGRGRRGRGRARGPAHRSGRAPGGAHGRGGGDPDPAPRLLRPRVVHARRAAGGAPDRPAARPDGGDRGPPGPL